MPPKPKFASSRANLEVGRTATVVVFFSERLSGHGPRRIRRVTETKRFHIKFSCRRPLRQPNAIYNNSYQKKPFLHFSLFFNQKNDRTSIPSKINRRTANKMNLTKWAPAEEEGRQRTAKPYNTSFLSCSLSPIYLLPQERNNDTVGGSRNTENPRDHWLTMEYEFSRTRFALQKGHVVY